MDRAYFVTARLMAGLLLLIGPLMIILTLARGGGGFTVGIVVGAAFTLLGAGRLYLARGGDR